jgi:acetyl esterase
LSVSLWLEIERVIARSTLALPPRLLRAVVGPSRRAPEGYPLDLQSEVMMALIHLLGEKAIEHVEPPLSRPRLEHAARVLEARVSGVTTTDTNVPGAEGPRRVRLYRPRGSAAGLLPGILWLHGGGFVLGSIESHDGVCRALAKEAGVAVAALDYRLAPEHRFPAGLMDAVAATRWFLEHGEELGFDPRAFAIGGDSAGGNLATVTCHLLRGSRRAPVFQLLVYPATDATRNEPSHLFFCDGLVLTEQNVSWFLDHYIAEPAQAKDPRVSPLRAEDLSGLPAALMMTAGFDPLRDEGRAYAERMRAAGVEVEFVCFEGSMHGFLNTAGGLVESARALTMAAARLRRALAPKVLEGARTESVTIGRRWGGSGGVELPPNETDERS